LCSVPLLPTTVTACGILRFNILSPSNHHTVFVDFDTKLLSGSLPSELASCKNPQFKSRDYENSELYVHLMHAYCNDHQVYQMAANAVDSANPAQLNSLDAAVGKAMEAGLPWCFHVRLDASDINHVAVVDGARTDGRCQTFPSDNECQ
jgi:hypothetical protein